MGWPLLSNTRPTPSEAQKTRNKETPKHRHGQGKSSILKVSESALQFLGQRTWLPTLQWECLSTTHLPGPPTLQWECLTTTHLPGPPTLQRECLTTTPSPRPSHPAMGVSDYHPISQALLPCNGSVRLPPHLPGPPTMQWECLTTTPSPRPSYPAMGVSDYHPSHLPGPHMVAVSTPQVFKLLVLLLPHTL
jgi:hypothetical protein